MSTDKKDTAPQAETEEVKEEIKPEETKAEEKDSSAEEAKCDKKNDKKASKKKDVKKEEKKADAYEAEIAALNDKYLRLCAEYDNFRRRSTREKGELYADIKSETIKAFLPVYDNLERAIKIETADAAYAKGVELIMSQFMKTMDQLGVTAIEDMGQKFDPNLHNAVMHVEDEEKGENEIVDVFQRGFKLDEKVIRFSMVKVAN